MSGLTSVATRPRLMRSTTTLMLLLCALASPAGAQKKPAAKKPAAPAAPAASTAAKTRTEHDLLGAKEVPADAYYGVQTARALENFQISGVMINHYPGFVEAWALVKLAAARQH